MSGTSRMLSVKAQRQVFEELARSKGLDPLLPDSWYKIPFDSISRLKSVRPILYLYKNNYSTALARIFPDINIDSNTIKQRNSKAIVLPQNEQQRLIRNLGSKLGHHSLEDYYKLSSLDFRNNGLRYLLYPHNDSAVRLITTAFPDHTWSEWLFDHAPSQLWSNKSNHVKYTEWLSSQLQLKTLDDWYKVTGKDVYQHRGKSLLVNSYSDSVASLVMASYPQHSWLPWLFSDGVPADFWKSSENCKQYLEWLGGKINFSEMNHWYNITRKHFTENNGKSLLEFFGTPDEVVRAAFPNHSWSLESFKGRKAQHRPDLAQQSSVLSVLKEVEARVGLQMMEEWYVISSAELFSVSNGRRLYNEYDRSLLKILQTAYPDHKWDEAKLKRNSKNKRQLLLEKIVNDLFEGFTILSNARKSTQLKFDSGNQPYMELDLYIPDLKLAIEYQDPHHYSHVWYTNKPLETYQQRDELKKNAAVSQGITLIHVPFWWDGTKESLIGTIREKRDDVLVQFSDASYTPIPAQIPDQALDFIMKDYYVPGLGVPMLATPLLTLNDFPATEWWMMEKYDGIRAFWSPIDKQFLSRSGRKLPVDAEIHALFSNIDFWLDGEIWFGAGEFDEAGKVAHKAAQINWEKFHYIAFDAPKCEGTYEERYNYLKQHIPQHERLIIPQYKSCSSTENMLQQTQEIIDNGGEGIIIRNPKSLYKQGRSSEFLKLKKYRDAEARIKSKKSDDKWECEMPNGVVFTAPVESSLRNKILEFKEGTIISFKHRGYASNGIPKLSIIYRIRNDIAWADLKSNSPSIKPSSYKEYAPYLNKVSDRKPLGFWNDKNNVKNWFEEFARNKGLDPSKLEMWKSVSLADLRAAKGSGSIGWKYGSIHKALQDVFPGAILSRYI